MTPVENKATLNDPTFLRKSEIMQIFSNKEWTGNLSSHEQEKAIKSLESGHIIYFPQLAFSLNQDEEHFLSPEYADPRAKNIGYHPLQKKLWGAQRLTDQEHLKLKNMMDRFSQSALRLMHEVFPHYKNHLTIARTSFRPVEIDGRITSYRKDDKRLHVDAFPSAPNQGKRILRVFCNINPHGEDRVWRTGEPFEKVAEQFLPLIRKPFPAKAACLRMLKITKSYRTLYDHYMLQIHDGMKANEHYQKQADQREVRFASGSTWIVQTDHVSHAAIKGQYLLEQTFSLPVTAMSEPIHSPLYILEKLLNKPLV